MTIQELQIVQAIQLNKLVLDNDEEQKLVKCFKNRIVHENFCMHLSLSKIFCSSSKDAFIYLDSWFLMISETDKFLQLEVSLLEEILSRSSLFVTTEIEVFQAVNKWINYNFTERGKFAKRLLNKIRLPLLPKKTLKTILTEKNCFKINKESKVVVNDVLKGNFDFYRYKPKLFFTARYCDHDSFDILYFGSYKKTKVAGEVYDDKIIRMKHSNDFNSEVVSSLVKKRYDSRVVYLRGNVYIFGGFASEVEMYTHLTKTCKVVANIEDINDQEFCCYALCGFMDKIYLFGGWDEFDNERDLCIEFDTKHFTWKHKSEMLETRENPAACVFEEKIIVSGGMQYTYDEFVDFVNFYDDENYQTINKVAAYDPINDFWTEFPTMNYSRCLHKSLVVKNKLFVIGGGTDINEVYDSTSKKFTVLKPSLDVLNIRENYPFAVFKVSLKLFVYFLGSSSIFFFDTKKRKWYKKYIKSIKNLPLFSATQVPLL